MAAYKHSSQRDAIRENLKHRKDHPTADMVYTDIRRDFPNISLGTVYRNLALLTQMGEIRKVTVGSGIEHYDGNTDPHNHFVCRSCGRILDIEGENDNRRLEEEAGKHIDGRIEDSSIVFYGVCGECLKNLQKE